MLDYEISYYRVLYRRWAFGKLKRCSRSFDTEEDAEEYALYLQSCERTGAETLHWSNPGDDDYDEDEFMSLDKIPLEELAEMVLRGEVPDGKTQAAVLRVYVMKQKEKNK